MAESYTGSFSLNSLGLGQSGLMQAYTTSLNAQGDATGYKPFAYNPDSGQVRRPRKGDPAIDSFQRYLEASMANNLPSYPLSNPFNHAAHYTNLVYAAVNGMMRALSSASIRLEIKRNGKSGIAAAAGEARDHDYVAFDDHYLANFLKKPNPADSFASFLAKCVLQYNLTGRLLVWGVPNKWGLPVRFYVLPTALCIPNPGVPTDQYPMGAWRVQNYYPSSGMVGILPGPAAGIASTPGALIDAREIYVMQNPHPLFNWASVSALDAISVQTDVVEMMDKAFWSAHRQGVRSSGILTAPGATADQIDDLNSAINSTYAGPDNAGKIWTVGGRVDAPSFTPLSVGPEQLEISARATYSAQIVAAVTGQELSVLGMKVDGVGSYSERWAAMADVRERAYIPFLNQLAAMLTGGPVADWGLEEKGVRVAIRLPRLNDPVMVQADTNAGAADGTMTTDEVRARRDMGPDPLGLGHLPPGIRSMMLQMSAEQGQLPPNPDLPGDDGSEEVVDIADPSDDGTALGALRASREEPDGEPIAPTAAVEAAKAQQGKPRSGQPRKPAGAGTKSKAGKGKPEKKAMPELAAHQTPLHEFVKQPLVRTVGEDFPEELYHGTIKKSAKAFQTGTDLPEHQRSKTLSEFGPDVVYASEATAPHQALMFGSGMSKAGARVMTALRLRKGAKVLDLTPYMTRRPAMWSADTEVLHVAHRPSFTADLQEWLQGRRVARGVGAMPADRLAGYTDPHADTFHAPSYAELLPKYAKDRGYAAMRLADETIITDRSAIIGARVAKPHEVDALRETADAGKAARTKHSLFTDAVDPRVKEDAHRQAVEAALRRRDHVPAYVLADYPDLHGEAKALPENPEHHTEAVHALHRMLQDDPLNHGLRQVYADALDDAGAHHEATVHRMIAAGTPEHPHPDWYAKSTDTELGRVASHVAHELTAVTRDVGWGIYSPHESSTDANAHAQNNEHDMAYNEHSSAMFRHRRERTHPYPGGDAQTEEDLTRHDIAARAHDVARLIHGQLDRGSRTVKSDLAMSAFDAGTGGTLVPEAGSATVATPPKKKRRVLSSRESHSVIERAVADVLGTAVEAKAELADPDPTPAFDRYAAHRKHLATLPVVDSSPLGNPVDHSNVSHVLTLQHPRRQIKAVFKPSEGEQPGLRMHIPMHAGAQAARESAASHVAEIAGYHDLVPATTLRHHDEQHGSVQRFVGDGILAAKLGHEERFGSNHDDVRRAAAFDYLIGNTDRHLGNWLVRPTPHGDKITLIDHGLAFPEKHPDGREAYNFEIMRHAMYHKPTRGEPAPNPGGTDPDGKWLAIRRTLTEHGLSSKAIADTGKRWRVLTSGRFHFGELLSEHPDALIGKLNATPTRTGG